MGPQYFSCAKNEASCIRVYVPTTLMGHGTGFRVAADTAVIFVCRRPPIWVYPGCGWYWRIARFHRAAPVPGADGLVGYSTTFFSPAGTGMLSGQNHAV